MKRYYVDHTHTPAGSESLYGFYNEQTDGEAGTFSMFEEAVDLVIQMRDEKRISDDHAQELVIQEISRFTKIVFDFSKDSSIHKMMHTKLMLMDKLHKLKIVSVDKGKRWSINKVKPPKEREKKPEH